MPEEALEQRIAILENLVEERLLLLGHRLSTLEATVADQGQRIADLIFKMMDCRTEILRMESNHARMRLEIIGGLVRPGPKTGF